MSLAQRACRRRCSWRSSSCARSWPRRAPPATTRRVQAMARAMRARVEAAMQAVTARAGDGRPAACRHRAGGAALLPPLHGRGGAARRRRRRRRVARHRDERSLMAVRRCSRSPSRGNRASRTRARAARSGSISARRTRSSRRFRPGSRSACATRRTGDALLPSVVHYGAAGTVIVGADARDRLAPLYPRDTHRVGEAVHGPRARRRRGDAPAHAVRFAPAAAGDPVVRFAVGDGARAVTPIEVSARSSRCCARAPSRSWAASSRAR